MVGIIVDLVFGGMRWGHLGGGFGAIWIAWYLQILMVCVLLVVCLCLVFGFYFVGLRCWIAGGLWIFYGFCVF